jgi:hypothetical protein
MTNAWEKNQKKGSCCRHKSNRNQWGRDVLRILWLHWEEYSAASEKKGVNKKSGMISRYTLTGAGENDLWLIIWVISFLSFSTYNIAVENPISLINFFSRGSFARQEIEGTYRIKTLHEHYGVLCSLGFVWDKCTFCFIQPCLWVTSAWPCYTAASLTLVENHIHTSNMSGTSVVKELDHIIYMKTR